LPGPFLTAAFSLLIAAAYARLLVWAMDTQPYNTWGALIFVPLVLAVNTVLLLAVTRREPDHWIRRVVFWGFIGKLGGVLARYAGGYWFYGGFADAARYSNYAASHYLEWRQGRFSWDAERAGTPVLEMITTAIYAVTGPSIVVGFLIFGTFAFWGLYLLHRACRVGIPEGNHRRYAVLVLLLPSLLYWPASIGKESWLLLFVGVTAYGAAWFFHGETVKGLMLLAGGMLGTVIIRPHLSVLLAIALVVAQLSRPAGRTSTGLLTKGIGVLVLAAAAVVLMTQSAQFLGIEDLSVESVSDRMEQANDQTAQGGSAFTPVPLSSPLGVPAAIVTVLFRPFPWEAGNLQMTLQGVEGLVLLALALMSLPRWVALPRLMRARPYLVFAISYALAFILAFSGFANFGILARQRVLMLPLFLVLLALPKQEKKGQPASAGASRKESALVRSG